VNVNLDVNPLSVQNSLRYSREGSRDVTDCIYSLDAKCTKWEHKGKNPLNER
jgi:hypothetical protein